MVEDSPWVVANATCSRIRGKESFNETGHRCLGSASREYWGSKGFGFPRCSETNIRVPGKLFRVQHRRLWLRSLVKPVVYLDFRAVVTIPHKTRNFYFGVVLFVCVSSLFLCFVVNYCSLVVSRWAIIAVFCLRWRDRTIFRMSTRFDRFIYTPNA